MEPVIEKLGKVSLTIDKDYWHINKEYRKLTMVEAYEIGVFISRKPVPKGTVITDRNYWLPITSSVRPNNIMTSSQAEKIFDEIFNSFEE